jgi:hypothetical protein
VTRSCFQTTPFERKASIENGLVTANIGNIRGRSLTLRMMLANRRGVE